MNDIKKPTNEHVRELVDIMKNEGEEATEKRFKEIYGIDGSTETKKSYNASEELIMSGLPVDVAKNERVRLFKDGKGLHDHIKGLVDTMTPRSPPGTSRSMPNYQPNTMIFKKTIEDFDRMFETKILRVGEDYKSFEYEKAVSIPYRDARICFLPNPLPESWNASFAKDVSEEILLGLPFQTTWIEATGSWDKGPASKIEIKNDQDGRNITIQFCGAFLQTVMRGSTPVLQVRAVMAAGAFKNDEYQNTVFIANYLLTTHLIEWVQKKVSVVDFTNFIEEDYKAYPILGPSVFPIVGFLRSLQNKEVRMGAERVNERMKIGSGKGKEIFKTKEVVHVCLTRKESALPKVGVFGREIDWSHRWEVMGHWRRISETGIGKNASGEYGVRGFTWVSPHERGPEDKPVVKKIRVVEP